MSNIEKQQINETISSQIKNEFFRILDRSTFQGLPNIFWSTSLISKTFWFVISAVSYLYCTSLIIGSILDFNKFEIVTRYENIFENQPLFPLLLICDHDKNRTKCEFNGKKCPEFSTSPSVECEVFNDKKSYPIIPLKSRSYGSKSGLRLSLYATNVSTGIRVYMANHSQEIVSDPRFISPEMRTTLAIKRIFENRLPAPYSDCQMNATGSKKIDELNKPYYRSECLYYCYYYLIAKNCNLLVKFHEFSYLYYIDIYNKFEPYFNLSIRNNCDMSLMNETKYNYSNDMIASCDKICPVECHSFELSMSEFGFKLPDGQYPKDYAELTVFYETFYYTVISQSPKVTFDSVLANIGGLVGLFLGATVLSFGEIFEFFIKTVGILITRKGITYHFSIGNTENICQIKSANKAKKKSQIEGFYRVRTSMFTKVQRLGVFSDLKNEILRLD